MSMTSVPDGSTEVAAAEAVALDLNRLSTAGRRSVPDECADRRQPPSPLAGVKLQPLSSEPSCVDR